MKKILLIIFIGCATVQMFGMQKVIGRFAPLRASGRKALNVTSIASNSLAHNNAKACVRLSHNAVNKNLIHTASASGEKQNQHIARANTKNNVLPFNYAQYMQHAFGIRNNQWDQESQNAQKSKLSLNRFALAGVVGLTSAALALYEKPAKAEGDQSKQAVRAWQPCKSFFDKKCGEEGKDFLFTSKFNHDGSKIVTVNGNHELKIWDVASGALLKKIENIFDLNPQFNHNGTQLIVGGNIWDLESGSIGGINGSYPQFTAERKKIVTLGSRDRIVLVSNASKPWEIIVAYNIEDRDSIDPNHYAINHDATVIAALNKDKKPILYRLDDGKCTLFKTLDGHNGAYIRDMQFSPDGRLLVTASNDGTAKVWDLATGLSTATFEHRGGYEWLRGHEMLVNSARFSPDGKHIITASSYIRIWDVKSGQLVTTIDSWGTASNWEWFSNTSSNGICVRYAEFSPDGKRIVAADLDGSAKMWEPAQ